jgi:type II restriction enzyme
MELTLPANVAEIYSSSSQRIRVMTEHWVSHSTFCPNCGNVLSQFANNKPVADFYCKNCSEEYELKSKHGNMGSKIVDGAYSTMIERLVSSNNPNFFFLTYNKVTLKVINFLTIPKYFFIPHIIEKRKPLNLTARRAGWIGCNIVMGNIPEFGKIFYIQNGIPSGRDEVLDRWNKTQFIKSTNDIEAKGWLLDVLVCVEKLKRKQFFKSETSFEQQCESKNTSTTTIPKR